MPSTKNTFHAVDNPVVDAYLKYLETGTDYRPVLQDEQEKSRKALQDAAAELAKNREDALKKAKVYLQKRKANQ